MPVNTIVKLTASNAAVYLSNPALGVPILARVVSSVEDRIKVEWLTARKGEINGWYMRRDFALFS